MKREANKDISWGYFGILKDIKVKPNVVIIVSEDGKEAKCSKKFFSEYKQIQEDFKDLKDKEIEIMTRNTTSGHKTWTDAWFTKMKEFK